MALAGELGRARKRRDLRTAYLYVRALVVRFRWSVCALVLAVVFGGTAHWLLSLPHPRSILTSYYDAWMALLGENVLSAADPWPFATCSACCTGSSILALSQYCVRCGCRSTSSKKTRDMSRRDRRHDATSLGLQRDFPRCPMRDRQPISAGSSQASEMIGASCSALNLPGEPLRSSSESTSIISASSFSSVVSPLCSAFGEPRALPVPAVPPPQDPLGANPQRPRLLDRRPAARRPQHDLDTLRESPLDGALPVQPLKDSTLPR